MPGDQQVLERSQLRKKLGVLEGLDEPGGRDLVRLPAGDVRALPQDHAARRTREAGDEIEQRGLARAVGAEDADDLALHDAERELRDRREAAEALGEPAHFKHGGG